MTNETNCPKCNAPLLRVVGFYGEPYYVDREPIKVCALRQLDSGELKLEDIYETERPHTCTSVQSAMPI